MKPPRVPLELVREEFHKRSWDSMLPDPSDPPSVRSEKRDRLIKLLEIKDVELASMKALSGPQDRRRRGYRRNRRDATCAVPLVGEARGSRAATASPTGTQCRPGRLVSQAWAQDSSKSAGDCQR